MIADCSQHRYDVFVSYSKKDQAFARGLATRLADDGLRVCYNESQKLTNDQQYNDEIIEEGLEHSSILLLCISRKYSISEVADFESQSIRFRDPLIKHRRFIYLQLDEFTAPGFLSHVSPIKWYLDPEKHYDSLKDTCLAYRENADGQTLSIHPIKSRYFPKEHGRRMPCIVLNEDASRAIAFQEKLGFEVWDVKNAKLKKRWNAGPVCCATPNDDFSRLLIGSADSTLRIINIEDGDLVRAFRGHLKGVFAVALHCSGKIAVSGSEDRTVRIWDTQNGQCLAILDGHFQTVSSVAISMAQKLIVSGSHDRSVRIWDYSRKKCIATLDGHDGEVMAVAICPDERRIVSGATDQTLRLWDMKTGQCLRVLEGHTGAIKCVGVSKDGKYLVSGADDNDIRLWELETGACIGVLTGHTEEICFIAYGINAKMIYSGAVDGGMCIWNLEEIDTARSFSESFLNYANAKVLLVGESGVGKTGLSNRLAHGKYEKTDSTVGAWSSQWRLPINNEDNALEREIWLWDFGGQADQRLVQQLFMDGASLAVLVCNASKEDLLTSIAEWDRDLTRASASPFARILVAGRVDAGGLRISRSVVEEWVRQKGYKGYLETSAKEDIGCKELRDAIVANIDWDRLPLLSNLHFKRIKDGIIEIKDRGEVLMQLPELREQLVVRLPGLHFTDRELATVISRLAAPGVVWDVGFGGYVLLKPECISIAGQAVVRTLRADERELGCISELRILSGDLIWPTDGSGNSVRMPEADEPVILRAMHKSLIQRGLCLRESSPQGSLLIFPSYARRERPAMADHPAVFVSYRFTGFLDEIYSTLVVRMHHTDAFDRADLWRYAADFKTQRGRRLGLKLIVLADGAGELEVYSEPAVSIDEKILFAKFVQEHLEKCAHDVKRLRHYYCPECATPVANLDVVMRKLEEKGRGASLPCVNCDEVGKRVALWDDIEEKFADLYLKQKVHEMDQQAQIMLDNESRELALVGDVISTVALANQIPRQYANSDHGIDMEIEFRNERGEASGHRIYLQLKSGDSYLRFRKRDDKEIFSINERHSRYWRSQAYPVWLVVKNSAGIRWMNVTEYLERKSEHGRTEVTQVEFNGAAFDAMAVWRMRQDVLDIEH